MAAVDAAQAVERVLDGATVGEVAENPQFVVVLFGGYLYFHKAPTPQAFHEETVRKLSKLYLYDC